MSGNISDVFYDFEIVFRRFEVFIGQVSDRFKNKSWCLVKNKYSIVLMETDVQLLEHTKLARGFRLVLPGT